MLPQNLTIFINEVATGHSFFQSIHSSFQKAAVIIIRHKTDLIAFILFCQFRITKIMRHLADLCFTVRAKGQ